MESDLKNQESELPTVQTYHSIFQNYNLTYWSNLITVNGIIISCLSILVSVNSKNLNNFIILLYIISLILSLFSILALIISMNIYRNHYGHSCAKLFLELRKIGYISKPSNFARSLIKGKWIKYLELISIILIVINILLIGLTVYLTN